VDKIYSSPLGRAQDTMRYTAQLTRVRPHTEEWLQEVWAKLKIENTPWGTQAAWDLAGEVIRGSHAPAYNLHQRVRYLKGIQGNIQNTLRTIGKNSDEFPRRLGYVRKQGRYVCIKPNRDKIAVFCHLGLALCWLTHLLELPVSLVWSGFWLPPSSITTILFDERSKKWAVPRCIGLGDVSHLHKAGLPVSASGIKANFY
jgi:probable phosphoglycerate mutase